jgi:hypothetical protein
LATPPAASAAASASQAADDSEWQAATNAGTLSAMRQYLVRFPSGVHAVRAQEVIRADDDKAWSEAERVGTALAFNLYVGRFPDGAMSCKPAARLTSSGSRPRHCRRRLSR